jgi:hypothetical protein
MRYPTATGDPLDPALPLREPLEQEYAAITWMHRTGLRPRSSLPSRSSNPSEALLVVCFLFTPRPPLSCRQPEWRGEPRLGLWPSEETVQTWMAPGLYLALQVVFYPIDIYLPTHLALGRLFKRRQTKERPGDWQLAQSGAQGEH